MQTTSIDSIAKFMVEQNGQHVHFDDDFIKKYGDLTVPRIVTPDAAGPASRIRQSLLADPRGFRIPNAGCLAVVEYMLRKQGISLRVFDSPGIAALPQPEHVSGLNYPSVAEFLCQHRNGTIQLPNNLRASIIIEIAVAFPGCRVILLDARIETLKKLSKQVINGLPPGMKGDVEVVHAKRRLHVDDEQPIPRIIFSTFIYAADCDFETCDIVMLLDARQVTHQRNRMALEACDARFRLFGFVNTGTRVSPNEAGLIMGTFGPQKLQLLSHGRIRRPVYVVGHDNRQPSVHLAEVQTSNNRHEDNFDFLGKCYWHNERRNRAIIQNARQLNDHPLCPSVTIMVKHLDHAAALARKLRDWKIYIAPADRCAVSRMNREFRERVESESRSASWSTGSCQIVMANAVGQFRGYLSRAIIWAGGGPVDEIPESWFYVRDVDGGSNGPTLIVDFQDRFNWVARKWSKQRFAAYNRKDIFRIGPTPAEGRIEAFLSGQREASNA